MTPANLEAINNLISLANQLPVGLRSDWEYTNHFELTSSVKGDYWWLDVPSLDHQNLSYQSTDGQRLGLLMDIAVAAQQALPALKELQCPS